MNNNALVYCRVSTGRQALQGLSLDEQKNRAIEYAKNRNLKIIYSELQVKSGRNNDISYLIGYTMSHIIITDISRYCRSVNYGMNVLENLTIAGKVIHFIKENIVVTSENMDKVKQRLAHELTKAEEESTRISERVKNIIKYKRKRGEYVGGLVPFGLDLEERICLNENGTQRNIKKYTFNQEEVNVIKFIDKCRSNRYTGEDLTNLMNKISIYQDPIELVHETITEHSDYFELSDVNTKPMENADICYLLNDYEVKYRGGPFSANIIKRIKPLSELKLYVEIEDQKDNEDIDNLVEQIGKLNVSEEQKNSIPSEVNLSEQIDETNICDEPEVKRARVNPELHNKDDDNPPMPKSDYKFMKEYEEFLEFKKFLEFKNRGIA